MDANSTHLPPDELAAYAARRLAATDVLRISDHLAACAACREQLATLRLPLRESWLGDFLVEPAVEIPDFADLAAELDGTLTPGKREELAAKLARSPAAREALADLAAFREQLANLPAKYHRADNAPAARTAHAPVDNVITPSPRHWQRAAAWATSLAALFVAIAIGWWAFPRHSQDPGGLLRDTSGRMVDLAGLPAGLRAAVDTAARTGQLPPTDATLAVGRETLAGHAAEGRMTAVSPVGMIVRARQPLLQWTPRLAATGYLVSIVAMDDGSLITSPPLPAAQTQWMPVETLQRDRTYQWQVEAMRGEEVIDRAPKPPTGEARFRILDAATNDGLLAVEKRAAAFPLVLGVAYWRAGLTAAAADQFHRLAQTHTQSVVVQRLEHAAGSDQAGMPLRGTP